MTKSRMRIGALLAVMLIMSMAFVSAVSATPSEDLKIKGPKLMKEKAFITNKSNAQGFVAYSDGSGVSILSGVTYDLDVTLTGVKDSGSYWFNHYGDSTASASENIDYIQASGTLMGPSLLSVDFTNKSLTKIQNKEDVLNESSIWDRSMDFENADSITTSSSRSINETQYDTLNLSELKVPDTIAMAMSETYPFKKNKVWTTSHIAEGENVTSYIFLANYKNESHDFLIFYFINYTQKPSYLKEELSTISLSAGKFQK